MISLSFYLSKLSVARPDLLAVFTSLSHSLNQLTRPPPTVSLSLSLSLSLTLTLPGLAEKGAQRLTGAELSAAQGLADEERWSLYYGVKALSRDDPEAQGE